MTAITLSPESISALAREIVAVQAETTRPELDAAGAMQITGHRTYRAFRDWCVARRVKAISRGRYRRAALMRAMGGAA